tara:strand:+ start:251 stop:409 length:159 start_codon:yes stop_codon:yes gene_type:complete
MPYDFSEDLKATILDITNTQRLLVREQELLKQQQEEQHQSDCDEGGLNELQF